MDEINYSIEIEYEDHHFRTEIPNFILDLGLTPYDIAVYMQLKRTAGDKGKCWKSNYSLACACQMSQNKLRECLKNLCDPEYLKCPALIKITERKKADGSCDSHLIQINNVWKINGDFYREKHMGGGTSPREGGVLHHVKGGTSPREPKEEHIKKNHNIKEDYKTTTTIPPIDSPLPTQTCKDGGGGGIENSSDLIYKNGKGEIKKISQSEIYKYFLKHELDTKIIMQAIEEARQSTDLISSIFRYLEAICMRLVNKRPIKQQKNNHPVEKKEDCGIPDKSHLPKVSMGEWAKKNNPVFAKMIGVV